jgi:dienelactone hydrolase
LPRSSLVGRGEKYEIHAVRWAAFGDVEARGLLLEPKDVPILAQVVAIPDCGVLPEQLVGLMPGVPAESQYARRLAENGCRVLVPLLVNRQEKFPQLSHREWLYRSAFELGRGLVAYEVQEVLAAVD